AAPAKRHKVVATHKAEQPFHTHPGRQPRHHHSHSKQRHVGGTQQVAVFVEVIHSSTKQHGNGQEKTEFGGCLSVEAHQHGTNDGGARAAHAGHQRCALNQAHLQGVAPTHAINVVNAHRRTPFLQVLCPQNQN